jgi:hypothetical protein
LSWRGGCRGEGGEREGEGGERVAGERVLRPGTCVSAGCG